MKVQVPDLILLDSVGTFFNPNTLDCFPAFDDGRPDIDNPTHLNDSTQEWEEALSPTDRYVTGAAALILQLQPSYYATSLCDTCHFVEIYGPDEVKINNPFHMEGDGCNNCIQGKIQVFKADNVLL